ncbi:MAG: S9 family peptidase [Candidatus Latescibacteria bacterium]|jgi:dipeptidyl aminopeptidase/acylaminoacyl peptidase|nr:S9 family peptidase [Candidatus Latescibacterota bacterium]
MNLSETVRLPSHLDRLTDTRLNLRRVRGIVRVGESTLFVALSGRGRDCFFKLALDGGILEPMGMFDVVDALWPGDETGALVEAEGAIWRVGLDGKKGRLISLPEGALSFDVKWGDQGLIVCALVKQQEKRRGKDPWFYPVPRTKATLCRYASTEGWRDLAEVNAGCGGLSMSADGQRMVWREAVNVVPEEAQRGELLGFDMADGEVKRLTDGAGKLHDVVMMASDGASFIYEANHEQDRPITTHTDLWWMTWDGKEHVNLTEGGRYIERFGWGPKEKTVWISFVEGLAMQTEVLALDGTPEGSFADLDASSPIVWMADGLAVFETEDAERFPAIWTGTRRVPLPQPENYEDLNVVELEWTSSDGLLISGVLYESDNTSGVAPLLVSAHGGPASSVENFRSDAVRYRHFLRAGYRVFRPAFRGSLGFGDEFAQGNIACQGEDDLADIVTGIDLLVAEGLADAERVGIFGGSYGGYMTLRALAVSDRFHAGVALYGFIDNRRMTLETGDFTYENEYIAPLSWPLTDEARKSDVFPHLGDIASPLLLIHGDADPICPVSESLVTCRALEAQGIPVGLVVYPGEGHGFRRKRNQRDCARRMLAWFLNYLPV